MTSQNPESGEVIRGLGAITGPAETAPAGESASFEGLLQFVERFEGHFTRIVNLIEGLQNRGRGQGRELQRGNVEMGEVENRPKKISTMKVYQAALGELANLSESMPGLTVDQALEMLRNNKAMALAVLEKRIAELQSD